MKQLPKIQIAGIKNIEEAQLCVEAGADGLGLLLMLDYPRGDAITPERARDIVRSVPDHVCTVLITHSTNPDEMIKAVKETGVNTLQIHNDSTDEMNPGELRRVREALPDISLIKVLHIPLQGNQQQQDAAITAARNMIPYVDCFILDSRAIEKIDGQDYQTLGGTGQLNDWHMARAIVDAIAPFPVIHAGGLDPDNVAVAIKNIRPYGVDVNSGTRREGSVEKDRDRVRAFVKNAQTAFSLYRA